MPRRAPIEQSGSGGAPFVVSAGRVTGEVRMRVVVVASGEMAADDVRWLDAADLVIAADGGSMALDRLGRRPDRLIGDLDSTDAALVERLAAHGVPVDRHPADKEATDLELALGAATAAGASEIVILGGLGGRRFDHELANLLVLSDPQLDGMDARIVHGPTTVRVLRPGARLVLAGTSGDVVSLLPIGGDASGVTTHGLRWALTDATLRLGASRGISNEIISMPASVSVERGLLVVIETTSEGAHP
ncbi:MAG TPA: thiamine diphosphokinase [Candidatus Limnocylindria bacterium]|nr:thiamine diphosphokinase [Candidatus Limnocylindria bacterium]